MGEAEGEVELDGKVMILKRIHVRYLLKADPANREAIDRVLEHHVANCPVARSLMPSIEITTSLELIPDPA